MMVHYDDKTRGLPKKKNSIKYFETKILITKIYNTSNQCNTIFTLLAPLDRNNEKDGD